MRELSQWELAIHTLSRSWGHWFESRTPIGAWTSDDGLTCAILMEQENSKFGYIVMRRRVDSVWTVTKEQYEIIFRRAAEEAIHPYLQSGMPPEPVPSGVASRPPLYKLGERPPSDIFRFLANPSHAPAGWTLNQLYLALPHPDKNWASDCQTSNFHTRLWEAHLLACFREQGLLVEQPYESPDFRIENFAGDVAWVEAVTANPPKRYNHFNAAPTDIPTEREELFFGRAALRFAKTIGNKLERSYEQLPHVCGYPFVLAVADFQEPRSMLWSREGLIGYLYGQGATVEKINGQMRAVPTYATTLLGPSAFPAGLFSDDRASKLSAVIFTNACSIGKLNRVAVSGQGAPKGYRYTRRGKFWDHSSGALKGIPFCMDITSDEYRALWPQGYEPWCAELEVFHNPFAEHALSLKLLPMATHWLLQDGERIGLKFYTTSILWSETCIQSSSKPPLTLDSFVNCKNMEDNEIISSNDEV